MSNPQLIEDQDGRGWAVYTIDRCALDFTRDVHESADCNGAITTVRGKAIVSAKRTVQGTLTGDRENPVVPTTPDAAKIEVTAAVLSNFSVESDDVDGKMTVYDGAISGVAEPRLARSASLGVCKVPSRDVLFKHIAFAPSHVNIQGDGHDIDADIDSSDLTAVLGKHNDRENALEGVISVWGGEQAIPIDGDEDGLMPDYDRDTFVEDMACTDDLAQPLSYQCASFGDLVADGAARLSVLAFGAVLEKVNDHCTFSTPRIEGALGEDGGRATYDLGSGCAIEGANVTGTKTVRGFVSGDPSTPIVPTSHMPAELNLRVEFHEFSATTDDGANTLYVRSGILSGRAKPRLAIDPATEACSVPTDDAAFEQLAWHDGDARIDTGGRSLDVALAASSIAADVRANTLAGAITVNGEEHMMQGTLTTEPAATAKPPLDDEECSLRHMLGAAIARLTIRSVGAISNLINNDGSCGFSAYGVLLFPTAVGGENGEQGFLEHTVESCELHPNVDVPDCLGEMETERGVVVVSGKRTVTGLRESKLIFIDSIVPNGFDSVTLDLDAELQHLYVADGPALTLESGHAKATVHAMTGENSSTPGTFDVPTPVAYFSSVELTNVGAVLQAENKTFKVNIESARLEAQNGSFGSRANAIRGTIVVDGRRVELALDALDPDFNQNEFDTRYRCTENLMTTVPPGSLPPPSL